jgi:diguanylate cyclase
MHGVRVNDRRNHSPVNAGTSYSLQQRYIVVTGVLTLLIIAFAWVAQSYVGEQGMEHLKNSEQRNRMAQVVRQLRSSVMSMRENLDAFMWEPSAEHRVAVHNSVNLTDRYFNELKKERWFNTLGYADKIDEFGIDLDSLHARLDHVMDTRLNARDNTPVINAIEQTTLASHRKFLSIGQKIIDSFNDTADGSSENQLQDLLGLILTRWRELNTSLTRYIEIRRSNPLSTKYLTQQNEINLLYDAIAIQLENIQQRQQQLLGERNSKYLVTMIAEMQKWQQGYQQIRSSTPDEYLRTDIPYLTHAIDPYFQFWWNYLGLLDQNIERYSENEANHQQIIMGSITDGIWAISLISLLILSMGYVYFERGILKPISRVALALRDEAKGDEPQPLPQVNSIETQQLIDAFGEMRQQVQDRQRALEHQALHDSLTSLPNRYKLQNELEEQCRIAQQKGAPIAVLTMGLDRFKDINDTLGHRIGDRILQLFGERLRFLVREGDLVARLGSDEFAILQSGIGQEEAIYTARKLLAEVMQPFQVEQINLYVGCSIGIAIYPTHATSPTELIRYADIAMHVAKQMKTGYSLYERKYDTNNILHLSLATDLRHAVQQDALQLNFQPQQFLHNSEYAGMEVLLRWNHPVHGYVSPEEFIPIAEQTGAIHSITHWVLENSFKQIRRWIKAGREPGLVSINISVFNLQDREFVDTLAEMMKQWDIDPQKLMLEVTETAMMADPINAKHTLERLNQLGLKIAIDDFGTGFSSLAYIKQLPVHELKIDKSFVCNMIYDENDAVIVHSTIDLAHNLGLKVIAEGVETGEITEQLKAWGCDVIQGHHYGKPLRADEIESLMPPLTAGGKVTHLKDYR